MTLEINPATGKGAYELVVERNGHQERWTRKSLRFAEADYKRCLRDDSTVSVALYRNDVLIKSVTD